MNNDLCVMIGSNVWIKVDLHPGNISKYVGCRVLFRARYNEEKNVVIVGKGRDSSTFWVMEWGNGNKYHLYGGYFSDWYVELNTLAKLEVEDWLGGGS